MVNIFSFFRFFYYELTLADLKKKIRTSQLKAAITVNKELIQLYWTIGKTIVAKQENSRWGINAMGGFLTGYNFLKLERPVPQT